VTHSGLISPVRQADNPLLASDLGRDARPLEPMATFQAWLLAFLALAAFGVETSQLYFRQSWSHSTSAVAIAAARRAPWSVLVQGSSQVFAGIIPQEVEEGLRASGLGDEKVFALGLFGGIAPTQLLSYRAVRKGHRPRAVILGLAARDLNANDFRDKLRVMVESSANLKEAFGFASYAPSERWRLPGYALRRDLGTPLQALCLLSPPLQERIRVVQELDGGAWPPPGREVRGFVPFQSIPRDQLLSIMRRESRGYEVADFPDAIIRLVGTIRSDGATPFLLVLPQSRWGTEHLPSRPSELFEESLSLIHDATGAPILRAMDLAPELAGSELYVDSIEHLSAEGAGILSRALGRAVGAGLTPVS
jgi:hypothetical protein